MILWCFLLISIINFVPLLWPFSDRWGKDLDNKSWIYTTYQKAYVKFWKLYTGFLVLEKNISKHSTLYSFFLYRIPFKGDLVCASSEQTWKPFITECFVQCRCKFSWNWPLGFQDEVENKQSLQQRWTTEKTLTRKALFQKPLGQVSLKEKQTHSI